MRRDSGPALAADHVVGDTAAFVAACRERLWRRMRIVTFGVQPEHAAIEYGSTAAGYVKAGYPLEQRKLHVSCCRSAR